ncbi:hypothetical protein BC332_30092 [Capsicum chinense]|nr:hypothetical protein BC332_30092 [Capsicum chinense]
MENEDRTWMYNRTYLNHVGLREEYKDGVAEFIAKAMTLDDFLTVGIIRYPYWKSNCGKLLSPDLVALHLYKNGFMLNYTVWIVYGECSFANDFSFQNYIESPIRENNVESSRYSEMAKCAWNSCHENEIQDIFKLKAALRIKEYLYEARRKLQKSGWLKNDVWVKFFEIWDTPECKAKRERAKANRASEMGDSLHTRGFAFSITFLWKSENMKCKLISSYNENSNKYASIPSKFGPIMKDFEKRIEDWRQTQSTSENGTMVQPSLADMTNMRTTMRTTMIGGPKKVRTYRCGVLQSSSSRCLPISLLLCKLW